MSRFFFSWHLWMFGLSSMSSLIHLTTTLACRLFLFTLLTLNFARIVWFRDCNEITQPETPWLTTVRKYNNYLNGPFFPSSQIDKKFKEIRESMRIKFRFEFYLVWRNSIWTVFGSDGTQSWWASLMTYCQSHIFESKWLLRKKKA